MRLLRHPGFHALERVATDDATPGDRRKVLRHLESCSECRSRLQWLRSLAVELEDATRPPLPHSLETRILARRAAGERVILPVRERAANPRALGRRGTWGVAAGIIITASVLSWVATRSTAEANAASGVLTLEPSAPQQGDRIQVEYRPGRELQGAPFLVLRGRVSTALRFERSEPVPRRLAVLERVDGVYRGSFSLGDGGVYADLVVEDPPGERVDDRGGRRWRLETYDGRRPGRDALWAHAHLATLYDWNEGYETIRRATQLYPDDPRLAGARLALELAIFTRTERDSALQAHRGVFRHLARALAARDSLAPRTLAGLVEYAHTVGDTIAERDWTRRLIDGYPYDVETIWYRVAPPADASGPRLDRYLADLETSWREGGPHAATSSAGLWAARRAGRPSEIMRWAHRATEAPGWGADRSEVPLILANTPAVRDSALPYLRTAIRRLDAGDVDRPLGRTVAAQRMASRREMRPLLVALAELLLARGERGAALDTLRVASSIGWSDQVYARLAALELAGGDTLSAAASLARATAAPFQGTVDEGLDPSLGPTLVEPEQWEILQRAARDDMHRRLLARSIDRPLLTEPVRVFDARGDGHDFEELRHRTVTIVAFWEPWSGPAVRALPELRRITYLVRALGGEIVVITRTPPSDRLATLFDEKDVRLPLYHDLDRRATEAFESTWSPEYYVLDFEGRIRFADSALEDVLAQVDALLDEPRLTAVVDQQ